MTVARHRRTGRRGRHRGPVRPRWRTRALATVAVGLLGAAAMTTAASQAAFSATTGNPANSLAAGAVTLTTDGAGSLYGTLSAVQPGDTATSCIKISYTGTVTAAVTLYGTVANNTGLGSYVQLTVDQGTAGPASSRSCATSPAFGGTVTNLTSGTAATALPATSATGYPCWTAAPGTARWYRITYAISDATPDSQQAKSVDVTLTWQATSV